MQDAKIPFGEQDGALFRAFEVENGLACGCICPGCRKPLNAANGGLKVIPHFRHAQSEYCAHSYKEGARWAAVALIAARRGLTLPAFSRQASATTVFGHSLFREVAFQATLVHGDSVERFVDLGDLLAHAFSMRMLASFLCESRSPPTLSTSGTNDFLALRPHRWRSI